MFFCCSGASLSTSSGNSTQKDPSPFEETCPEIVEQPGRKIRNYLFISVPSPIPPPRSPRQSFEAVGSPLASNQTFVEEQSIDISFSRFVVKKSIFPPQLCSAEKNDFSRIFNYLKASPLRHPI